MFCVSFTQTFIKTSIFFSAPIIKLPARGGGVRVLLFMRELIAFVLGEAMCCFLIVWLASAYSICILYSRTHRGAAQIWARVLLIEREEKTRQRLTCKRRHTNIITEKICAYFQFFPTQQQNCIWKSIAFYKLKMNCTKKNEILNLSMGCVDN